MGFKCGIVGLPNVGKSTLFNALTNSNKAQAANFPFCTIDPNVGVVAVPDCRLLNLAKISKSKKIINEFQDEIKNLESLTRDNLEPIVNNLIKKHETNFKGVGQPLRVALTGSKFGPGLYDIVMSLGKADVEKRLRKILN